MSGPPPDFEDRVAEMVGRMRPRLKRILASFRIPPADSEDLLQEAFLALCRDWRRIEHPEAWLAGALVRMCCTYTTRARRQRLRYLEAGHLEALAPEQPPAQERAALFRDLNTLVAILPRRYQLLLLLRYAAGLPPEEVPARLGYRPASIRKLSLRAVARLRGAV